MRANFHVTSTSRSQNDGLFTNRPSHPCDITAAPGRRNSAPVDHAVGFRAALSSDALQAVLGGAAVSTNGNSCASIDARSGWPLRDQLLFARRASRRRILLRT